MNRYLRYLVSFFLFSTSSFIFAQQWVLDEIDEEQEGTGGFPIPGIILTLLIFAAIYLIGNLFDRKNPSKNNYHQDNEIDDYPYDDKDEDKDDIDIVEYEREESLRHSSNILMDSILFPDKDEYNDSYVSKKKNDEHFDEANIRKDSHSSIESQSITSQNFEAVDLGLSVLWCSCNLGASCSTEFGHYYAWGEIEPSETWHSGLVYKLEKKRAEEIKNLFGSDTCSYSGNTLFDAASKELGSNWRTPSKNELEELFTQCNWELIEISSIKGYKATGPNGNHIFFPLAGHWCIDHPIFVGTSATLMSSEAYLGYKVIRDECSYFLLLQPFDPPYNSRITALARRTICPIRPVKDK